MDIAAGQTGTRPDSPPAPDDREIERRLSDPTAGAIDAVRALPGDFIVLGASGKMGVTLAAMLRRALDAAGRSETRVTGAARFRDPRPRELLESFGVEPVTCDLGDYDAVMALPEAANVFYLAGQKFGTVGAPEETWMQNTVVPSHVARRYRASRVVVFSTGCVYPFYPVNGRGADEASPLGFLGEYAITCIGRERIFAYYAEAFKMPTLLFRLNYSVEYRYGVLVDIAQRILNGQPIDLGMPVINVIWQQDACGRAIESLRLAAVPAKALNVTGGEKIQVAAVAEKFGARFGRVPTWSGKPGANAWHIDASQSVRLFGAPTWSLDAMVAEVADHLLAGGRLLGKPTNFEVRDGNF